MLQWGSEEVRGQIVERVDRFAMPVFGLSLHPLGPLPWPLATSVLPSSLLWRYLEAIVRYRYQINLIRCI